MPKKHEISIVTQGVKLSNWTSYSIANSIIEPADSFTLTRPFTQEAWNVLPRDAAVRVQIDGTTVLRGFIDKRRKSTEDGGTIEITGRDRAGRLVQESAPSVNYAKLTLVEAIRRLASPWFETVTLSDARNRSVRRGKGRRVPAGDEPVVISTPVPRRGKVQPGQSRWAVIEDIATAAGLIVWSTADGRELFIGRPNYAQAAQFLIHHVRPGSPSRSTCSSLDLSEDNGDRFSLIAVVGTNSGDAANYGANVTSRSGRALDYDSEDGSGRDFLAPKRLLMPERDFESNGDARRVAEREQARRDFKRSSSVAKVWGHGQIIGGGTPTIFAPNTIARVIDEDFEPFADDEWLIHTLSFDGDRDGAEITTLEMVPTGTEILL